MYKELDGFVIIYMFTSPSGKKYIGQSINFINRYKKYKHNKNSIGEYFSKAIKKHDGIENFKLEILEKFLFLETIDETKTKLNELEIYYINKHDTLNNGYNLTAGGKGSFKRKITNETRLKLSLNNKGKNTVECVELKCPICNSRFKRKPYQISKRIKNNKIPCCSRICGYEMMKKTSLENNNQ